MRLNHKYITLLCLVAVLVMAFAGSQHTQPRNLKLLPKDISHERLDSIMYSYNNALGVSCDFCHFSKNNKLDFASDENPVKETARRMLEMTISLNRKYFNFDSTIHPAYLNMVTCNTCHKGNAVPQQH